MLKKVLTAIGLLLVISTNSFGEGKYSCLFPNDPEFSERTNYMSYEGIIRLGVFEASRTHSWVDRVEISQYLSAEKKMVSNCQEAKSNGGINSTR